MKFPSFFNTVLEALRVKTPVAGLEISDLTLRLAVPGSERWDIYNERLPLGVIEDGVVKDPVRFKESILSLKKLAAERYGKRKIPVVVSLVSSQIYTQAFPLPVVQEGETEKVIALNLKMISPLNFDDVYVGWQYVKKESSAGRFEILGAFLKRPVVLGIESALEGGGFRPLALEPRSLSLARLIRNLGMGAVGGKPAAVLSVSEEGLNFLVVKEGQMYFEYTELWKNLYDPGKYISLDEFKAAIKRSVQQLINFYSQRWPEPLGEFLIIAPSLVSEVEKILKDDFSFPAHELIFPQDTKIGGEWFATIGAAWRGTSMNGKDEELSLLGHTAHHIFTRERFVDFLLFWRIVAPVVLTVILLIVMTTDFLIIREIGRLQATSTSRVSPEDRASFLALEAKAQKFNEDVNLIKSIRSAENFKSSFIKDIFGRAGSSSVQITSLRFEQNGSFLLSGQAASEDRIILLKNSLIEGGYQNADLPLSGIRSDGQGYVFSMTFSRSSSNTP